jgi:hypothetical protein
MKELFTEKERQQIAAALTGLVDRIANLRPGTKCYITGKITGLPEETMRQAFEEAEKEVRALGMVPVSPITLPHNHGRSWAEYMREDLRAMLECSHVYALRNWRLSPGATIEITTALQVGINVIHQK